MVWRRMLRDKWRTIRDTVRVRGKTKFFCIGCNKTGTTSLARAFKDHGFVVGRQRSAEWLCAWHYRRSEFGRLIEYCRTAQVFQDIPFSLSGTYRVMDEAFPGSKFILTVRDSADQWYESVVRFQSKKFGKDGRVPTAKDLREASYLYPGWPYERHKMYGVADEDLFNRAKLIAYYERHTAEVIEYFRARPEDLLVLNLAEPGAFDAFVRFAGVDPRYEDFPWLNRT